MSSTITPPGSASDRFPLPLELFREITGHLEPTEQRTLTLVSRVVRDQILDIAFKRLSFSRYSITEKLDPGKQPREDVKGAVRSVFAKPFIYIPKAFYFRKQTTATSEDLIPPRELFDSIRDAHLSELALDTRRYFIVEGPPTDGIACLKRLSIRWSGNDSPSTPGSSLDHLYHLIRPSLSTLVELRIENYPETGNDLDLRLLRQAGETLRVFDYSMRNHDEGVLDLIPEIFPHLTKLALQWELLVVSDETLDSYIVPLSQNKNLLDLQLSFDFENIHNDLVRRTDADYAWYIRCYKRRLEATHKLVGAGVLPLLRTCGWVHLGTGPKVRSMLHSFAIEDRGPEIASRVVRGVKQSWMGADHEDERRGRITTVKCKLEDLPGDIIGENDPSEEEEA
ncbi:hypothetical protein H0H92_014288 [Tricholoma furcatifolium]|nr:hypothetical protein H0H92_014288 [Tricholoma furcatifolium]